MMALGMEVANRGTEVESIGSDGKISRRKDSTLPPNVGVLQGSLGICSSLRSSGTTTSTPMASLII